MIVNGSRGLANAGSGSEPDSTQAAETAAPGKTLTTSGGNGGKKKPASKKKPPIKKKTGPKKKRKITHVGLVTVVEKGDVTFIHASSSIGVSEAKLSSNYFSKRFRMARRVL